MDNKTRSKAPARASARRRAILDAATRLFLEKGFESTTLSDIVELSGGSRTTVYEQFGNKEGLLKAMVEDSSARVWEQLGWDGAAPPMSEEALIEYGCRFLAAISTPEAIAVYRIVFAESHRMPDVARLFLQRGPEAVRRQLNDWFSAALAAGHLRVGTSDELAQAFIGVVLGELHLCNSIIGVPTELSSMQDYIRTAVRIFLRGAA